MINPGKLICLIAIQTNTPVQDSELNWTDSWADTVSVWAEPLDETSREVYRLKTENSEISRVFRIAYRSGVTAQQRIRYGTEYYQIIGKPINEGERNMSLLIATRAVI